MFKLPELPYKYDALEPYIDAVTMEIHHTKHHKTYTDKLNTAIEGTSMEGKSIEEILRGLDMENKAVRNNGGGYYNHNMFWQIMSGEKSEMSAELKKAIDASFGSFEAFKSEFSKAGADRFGSGWAWLCAAKGGGLKVCSTANQDNPLMSGMECGTPILCLDVWEHAYYLKYQNKRPDYIDAFFSVINWKKVSELYSSAK